MAVSKKALKKAAQKSQGKPFVNKGRPDTSNPKTHKAPAKPGKSKPTAESYAAQDPNYRRAVASYRTNLANLKSQNNANKNDLTADYTTTRSRLLQQFDQNNKTQSSDFANRGMFGSGVYAKAKADSSTDQTNQLNDAQDSYNRNARQIDTDTANATTLEQQQEQTAKASAIQRAAAKYGITGHTVKNHKKKNK
jgi:hypothetical protein